MRLFRRSARDEPDWRTLPCTPFDFDSWWQEVAEGIRTDIPSDGSYLVAHWIERSGLPCLVFERFVAPSDAEAVLHEFAHRYHKKPQRVGNAAHDLPVGMWITHPFKKPYPRIAIVDPSVFRRISAVVDAVDRHYTMVGAEHAERAALPSEPLFSGSEWVFVLPSPRTMVSLGEYGERLNRALFEVSTFDPECDTISGLRATVQHWAFQVADVPLVENLDSSALAYLSARLWEEKAEELWNAALFGPSDPAQRQLLADERQEASQEAWAASELLKLCLHSLYKDARTVFDGLQLDAETLQSLGLNVLVEDGNGPQQSKSSDTLLRPDDV